MKDLDCQLQVELSGAKITVILQNETVSCVPFELDSSILRLSGIQLFDPVHNWSQAPFNRRTLPLMQITRSCNITGISVQHKFSLQIWLRQSSRLDQTNLMALKYCCCSSTHASNSMQRGHKLGIPRNKLALIIGEAQKDLQLCLVPGYFPIAELRYFFRVRFDTFCRDHTSQVLEFRIHKVALSDSHLEASFSQTFKHLA